MFMIYGGIRYQSHLKHFGEVIQLWIYYCSSV